MLTMSVSFRMVEATTHLLGNEEKYNTRHNTPIDLMGWIKSILLFPYRFVLGVFWLAFLPVVVFFLWVTYKTFLGLDRWVAEMEVETKAQAEAAFKIYNRLKKFSTEALPMSNIWGVAYLRGIRDAAIRYELILRKKLYTQLPPEITQAEVDEHHAKTKGWEDDWDDEGMDVYDIEFNPKFKS